MAGNWSDVMVSRYIDREFEIIMKFIEMGYDENSGFYEIKEALEREGIHLEDEELRTDIELIRLKRLQKLQLDRIEALLFIRDGRIKPHDFRFGSAFCPRCGLFKNYEKECPHCGFHEMTP